MRAGKLRQNIVIQSRTENGSVEYPDVTWTNFAAVKADVQDLSTRDSIQAQAVGVLITARAVVRYSDKMAKVNHSMRVFFNGYYYQINGTPKKDLYDMRTYITIELKEGLKEWLETT